MANEKEVTYTIGGKDVSKQAVDSAIANMKRLEGESKTSSEKMQSQWEKTRAAYTQLSTSIASTYYMAKELFNYLSAPFIKGFEAVENYTLAVASLAAMVMTFAENKNGASMQDQWKESYRYASAMVPILENIAAKTLLSGQETTALANAFARSGVFLDATNAKQVEAFTRISNALPLMTQGQEIMRQINTEIRSLMNGTNESTSMMLTTLKSIDPEIEKHLKTWRAEGTVMEHIGDLLVGFGPATAILENQWQAVKSTIDTTVTQTLRAGMWGVYNEIIGQVKSINKFLVEHKEQIGTGINQAWLTVKGVLETVWNLLSPMAPLIKTLLGYVGLIGKGWGYIAYAILPVLSERIGAIAGILFSAVSSIANIPRLMAYAITGQWDLARGVANDMKAAFTEAGAKVKDVFSKSITDDIINRIREFDETAGKAMEATKPPKGSFLDPESAKDAAKAAREAAREEKLIADEIFKEAQRQSDEMRRIKEISASEAETIRKLELQGEEEKARAEIRLIKDILDAREELIDQQTRMDFDLMASGFADTSAGGPFMDIMDALSTEGIYNRQIALAEETYNAELEAAKTFSDAKLQLLYNTTDREAIITAASAAKLTAIDKAQYAQRIKITSSVFGTISGIAQSFYQASGEQSRLAFQVYKTAAIAETIISTYASAQKSYDALCMIPIVGPALGKAAAAAAIIAGMARVAAIQSTEFGGSSSVSDTSSSYASSSSSSTETAATTTTETAARPVTYQITVMGNIVDHDAFARELMKSIRKAEEDNA